MDLYSISEVKECCYAPLASFYARLPEKPYRPAGLHRLDGPRPNLINLARGPIAEEEALYCALRDGGIGGAALDTWWRYPSAGDPAPRPSRYPFHELPNVIMTPHCSPRTDGT